MPSICSRYQAEAGRQYLAYLVHSMCESLDRLRALGVGIYT